MGYIIRNLLLKNEKQEDILASYLTYLNKISDIIDMSDKKIHEIDIKGSFESDDEIGFFFTNIKMIQDVLNQFRIKNL
jgi:selenophosphate synthase